MIKREAKRQLILERFTPYRIVALGHAVSGKLARAYANEEITIPEWRVLAVIAQAESVASRDVVAKTPMDKMTVSRAVASLETKSIVMRATSEHDRRVAMLSLTDGGRALFDRIAALALDYEDALLVVLSDQERTQFNEILAKLEQQAQNV